MITMLDDGLPDLPGQVQSIEFAVAFFQHVHHPQGVGIVVETSMVGHQLIESILTGVAEGRVPEIMRERNRLDKILVQSKGPGYRTRNLRNLEGMCQAGSIMVAFMVDENLGLVLKPAESRRVNDPVAIALEIGSETGIGFRMPPPAAAIAAAGIGSQGGILALLNRFFIE